MAQVAHAAPRGVSSPDSPIPFVPCHRPAGPSAVAIGRAGPGYRPSPPAGPGPQHGDGAGTRTRRFCLPGPARPWRRR